jgi:hypothetical protein
MTNLGNTTQIPVPQPASYISRGIINVARTELPNLQNFKYRRFVFVSAQAGSFAVEENLKCFQLFQINSLFITITK